MNDRKPDIPRDRLVLHKAGVLTRKTLDRDAAPLSPSDMAWLFDRPTVWLRAVQTIQHDTERLARDANTAIKVLRGGDRTAVPEGWSETKAEYDRAKKSRTRFLAVLKQYREEVKAIVGPQALHAGDVIDMLTEVAALLDGGDVESGLDLLLTAIENWSTAGAGLRPPAHLITDSNIRPDQPD